MTDLPLVLTKQNNTTKLTETPQLLQQLSLTLLIATAPLHIREPPQNSAYINRPHIIKGVSDEEEGCTCIPALVRVFLKSERRGGFMNTFL